MASERPCATSSTPFCCGWAEACQPAAASMKQKTSRARMAELAFVYLNSINLADRPYNYIELDQRSNRSTGRSRLGQSARPRLSPVERPFTGRLQRRRCRHRVHHLIEARRINRLRCAVNGLLSVAQSRQSACRNKCRLSKTDIGVAPKQPPEAHPPIEHRC